MSNSAHTDGGSSGSQRVEKVVIVLALAAFLALSLYQLQLPGLHYDEAKEAGLPALQLLRGLPVDAFRGSGVRVGGLLLPLMVVDYIGATNVYLALPFLSIGGVNVAALRALPISLALLSLFLLHALAREIYNARTASLAFLLLAVNPSFVFWSRQGVFVTSTTVPLSLAAALCLLRWHRNRSRQHLFLGAFLLGLGLYTKFIFLWVVIAFAFVFLLCNGSRRLQHAPSAGTQTLLPSPAETVASLLAFLAGIGPLLVYNLQTGGTFHFFGENLTKSYYGTDNLAFLQNLGTRLAQLKAVLNGSHFWYLGGIFENPLWPYAAAAALLVGGGLAIAAGKGELRRWAFPWLICLVILVASCFTVSALWPTHYAILTPWPPLALAATSDLLWRRSRALWGVRALAVIAVVALVLLDVRVDLAYHRVLSDTGGLAGHTSAIYELADYLEDNRLTAPLAMDWGIAAPVEFLTAGRVRPIEVFGYEWDAEQAFQERLRPFLDNPDTVYIFHAPAETVFPRTEAFRALLSTHGKTSRTEAVFHQQNGKAIFTLVRLLDKPT